MKLLVYGFYGKKNCGDESYMISFPRLLEGHELTFTADLTPELVDSHDAIILGGGNVLNMHHLLKLQPHAGKPMVAFSVGCTDDIDFGLLSMFSEIYVRDHVAERRLRAAGVGCCYCPDAAFDFEPNVERGREILSRLSIGHMLDKRETTIAVVVNGHLGGFGQASLARDTSRFEMFSLDMANVLDLLDASVIFLPMMSRLPWDDRVTNGWVASRCKHWSKVVSVYEEIDVQSTLDVIGAMDAVVSTRLHSSIFSCVSGVPFVDIHHHDKNLGFLETIDRLGWAVPFWDFSREKTHELVSGMLGDSREGEVLREQALEKRRLLRGLVHGICFNK